MYLIPFRDKNSIGYRYEFQGQEKDLEIGIEAFQLHMYDGRIGRWFAPDPYGQYDSPYMAMGNNPISMIDPDGGFAGEGNPPGWFGRFFKKIGNFLNGSTESDNEATYDGGTLQEVVISGAKANHISKRLSVKMLSRLTSVITSCLTPILWQNFQKIILPRFCHKLFVHF